MNKTQAFHQAWAAGPARVAPLKSRLLKILSFFTLLAGAVALYPKFQEYRDRGGQNSALSVPASAPASESDFARAETFRQTLRYLVKNYYDTEALGPKSLLKEALLGLSRSVPEILVLFPDGAGSFTLEVGDKKKTINLPNMKTAEDMLPVVQETFSFIEANYKGEVKLEDMQYAAVNGMLDSLDPHSALLPPKIFTEFKTQTEGEFGGIGIVIGLKDGELTVIAPLPNTPAARAGLKPKDKIVKIGEEASINMDLTEAVERLRGKIGTTVTITVTREGAEAPMDFTLTRANIKIESVQSKLAESPEGDIGILKVKSFQEETGREMNRHLKMMRDKSKNFKGLVLDLRNNPGGLLNQAVDIADKFLAKGTIVLTVGANNQILEVDEAQAGDTEPDYPIVVLVNDGSASASEIVAGALKNNNRGVVLGTQTFGKGSVQSVYSLKDGSALKMTVAQYLTPGNESIQSVGITPDIQLVPESVQKDKVDLIESQTFGEKDLEKHLESKFKTSGKPTYTLGFYQEKKGDKDKEEGEEDRSNYSNEVEEDFQIKFAEQILRKVDSADRKKMLAETKDLVANVANEEDKKIQTALAGVGVDWSLSPAAGKPQAAVTFNIQSSAGQVLKAGEEVKLDLQVRNVGQGPFYQLIASTESDNFLLKNREFIFGKLNPGESRSWTVPIKIPAAALRREDKMTFVFREGNGNVPEKFQSMVLTEPMARPTFAYQYELVDDGRHESRGNANQRVEKGEKDALKVTVKNEGPGISKKTAVNLKNLDGGGIFLGKGREKLDELPVGATKEATLNFTVDKSYTKDKVELELSVSDQETQEILGDKLTIPLDGGQISPPPGVLESAPVIHLDKAPYPSRSGEKKITVSGKVEDPSGLKDISLYVGDYKAYLKAFEADAATGKAATSATFEATLPLKEKENNLISILARDKNDLVSRQSFYILQE
ncbi:MAG: MXAN_5808 family serine peptidase [bacterium]